MYDKLKNGLKSRHARRVQFYESNSFQPDESTIRLDDVDRQIDKVLEMVHEQDHCIRKFCDKLGLVGHELPTISREIEKLVTKCKTLEAKVNRMSVNELFSQYLKEETSASSFSSAIQRGRTSEFVAVRTSSPKTTLDLQRTSSKTVYSSEQTDGEAFVGELSDFKKDRQDNDYLSSIHPNIKQTPSKNKIRTESTRTSDIIHTHLTPFERALLGSENKKSFQTSRNLNFQFETGLRSPGKGNQRTNVWSTGASKPHKHSRRPHRPPFPSQGMSVMRE